MLNTTIHYGACVNTVTVDGRVFDRNQMTDAENSRLRRLVRMAFEKVQKKGS